MPLSPLVQRLMQQADGGNQAAPMGEQQSSQPSWYTGLVRGLSQGVKFTPGTPGAAAGGGTLGALNNGGGDMVDRIMRTIRQNESGNNYKIYSGLGGSASGAYQFVRNTWNNYGGYRNAADAPAHIQDQRAREDVTKFLRMYNNDPVSVAVAWFAGPGAVKPGSDYNYHPGGPSGNPNVSTYIKKFMNTYNSMG